jgi:hypothetical protein
VTEVLGLNVEDMRLADILVLARGLATHFDVLVGEVMGTIIVVGASDSGQHIIFPAWLPRDAEAKTTY